MRKFTLIAAGALFALAAPTFAETPKDTVVMAKQIDDIISLDPGESFEFSGSEAVGNMYDRLLDFSFDDVSDIRGRIAEKWSVAGDGKTYTLKIRRGLKFESGNPITAHDAEYSLRRAVILNKSPGFILTQFGFSKDNVEQTIKAADDETLVLITGQQVAPTFFYYCLTAVVGGIVDSKIVKSHEQGGDYGNAWLKNHSAASGPFKLVSWRANEAYTLERNDQYAGQEKPTIKRVVVRHVGEPATQLLLLTKGDVDYARNLSKDQIDAVGTDPNLVVQSGLKGSILYLGLNQKNQYLKRPEVREALKYLVDYDAIEKNIVRGRFTVHQAFLPKGFLGAVGDNPYKFDIAKAKALLAKAGLADGFTVTMDTRNVSPYTDIAQAIQATWAQAGVKLTLIPGDGKQTLTKYRARNHDIYIGQWGADYQDPHSNAQAFAMNPDNGDNASQKTLAWRNAWDIPDMTKAIEAASREQDAGKRKAAYEKLQREHMQVSPFVIMFQETEVSAHRKAVDGFVIGPNFDNNLYWALKKQ